VKAAAQHSSSELGSAFALHFPCIVIRKKFRLQFTVYRLQIITLASHQHKKQQLKILNDRSAMPLARSKNKDNMSAALQQFFHQLPTPNSQLLTLNNQHLTPKAMKNKETWKFIIQTLAAILTAIATSLGVSSCITAI
jgi:hypothetical protein